MLEDNIDEWFHNSIYTFWAVSKLVCIRVVNYVRLRVRQIDDSCPGIVKMYWEWVLWSYSNEGECSSVHLKMERKINHSGMHTISHLTRNIRLLQWYLNIIKEHSGKDLKNVLAVVSFFDFKFRELGVWNCIFPAWKEARCFRYMITMSYLLFLLLYNMFAFFIILG